MQSDSAAFQVLTNALQAADLRQQVYANNIANMQTPGYKREDVQFETLLQGALMSSGSSSSSSTGGQTIPISSGNAINWSNGLGVHPVVVQDGTRAIDNNGNNVDVDAEMAALAENQIKYQTLVADLQARIAREKTAITGG